MQVLLIYVSTKISRPVSIALSAVSSLGVMFATIAMSRNIIIGQSDPISADLVNFANRFESQRIIIRNKENYNRSTEDMYRSKDGKLYGKYKEVRNRLDYSFHSIYSEDRVYFQDRLIDSFLGDKVVNTTDNNSCSFPAKPWIVFTAGAMGAGKSHTIKQLDQRGYFPLQSFVTVDPDQIRHNLPEFDSFALYNPDNAGYLTRKECGMISEIIIELALDRGQNVLVDGTLRDADWYLGFFQNIRNSHPNTRIAILHVTAPRESVMENALNRAKMTGRVVPKPLLEKTIEQVPRSVAKLSPLVDLCVEFHNSGEKDNVQLVTPGLEWDTFRRYWDQKCLRLSQIVR